MRTRAVCDTNTVVLALLFQQGSLAWMRTAWASGAIVPVVCKETVDELLRVLAYPKFKLSRAAIDDLLGDFLPFADVHALTPATWPDCRDENDRVFLAFAQQADVDALITGDRDLLEVAEGFPVQILTPADMKRGIGYGA